MTATGTKMEQPQDLDTTRSHRMLRTALGPLLLTRLDDPGVAELMLNPDGRVWLDRFDTGLIDAELSVAPADAERIIRLVAHHVGIEVHSNQPRLSAELPVTGERFEGVIPPVVAAPSFSIRKPARQIFSLADYVRTGVMTADEAGLLEQAVGARRNILVVGPTSSGKTTLVNALLAKVAESMDRVVLCEDLRELQCAAPNLIAMRTIDGVVSLSDLVRSTLRLRPDRIVIGEVRGGEALDLIKAWGTGILAGSGPCMPGRPWGLCSDWSN
jgi:P-type conjugative transfer ATPase TrbB